MAPPGMEEMGQQLRQMFSQVAGGKPHKRKLTVKAARDQLLEEDAARLVNEDDVRDQAIEAHHDPRMIIVAKIGKPMMTAR